MTGKSQPGRVIIRSSHEDLSDPTAHLLMPTAEQGPFPPFDRFAESVATSRMQAGLHPHLSEEVVAYVLDGYVRHEDGTGNHTVMNPGSVLVVHDTSSGNVAFVGAPRLGVNATVHGPSSVATVVSVRSGTRRDVATARVRKTTNTASLAVIGSGTTVRPTSMR